MFYCIGLNELSEHRDNIIECIKERLQLFKDNSGSIDVTIALYPQSIAEWNKIDQNLTNELLTLISEYSGKDPEQLLEDRKMCNTFNGWCDYVEIRQSNYAKLVKGHTAYYGSASPLVPLFVHERKPVMISGY